MAVPVILPNGYILVYGWGLDQSPNNIVPDNTVFKFGSVYQVWDGGAAFIYGGDQVMWKEGDEYCKLAYAGRPYTQIKCQLVTKQVIPT